MECILVVDDEVGILNAMRRVLRAGLQTPSGEPYELALFSDPVQALRSAQQRDYVLALSDYRMPELNGVELLAGLRTLQPDCARIIVSGYADLNALMAAINEAGIQRFISKPWNDHDLLCSLRQVLQIRALEQENRYLADLVRKQQGQLSAQELELRRLEQLEPGITQVNWGPDGSILLEDPGEVDL